MCIVIISLKTAFAEKTFPLIPVEHALPTTIKTVPPPAARGCCSTLSRPSGLSSELEGCFLQAWLFWPMTPFPACVAVVTGEPCRADSLGLAPAQWGSNPPSSIWKALSPAQPSCLAADSAGDVPIHPLFLCINKSKFIWTVLHSGFLYVAPPPTEQRPLHIPASSIHDQVMETYRDCGWDSSL